MDYRKKILSWISRNSGDSLFSKYHLVVFLIYSTLIGLLMLFFNVPDVAIGNTYFGAEYGNIAEAIVEGKGFANPFETESGPTAWMPPLYPYLIASVFWVFGVKTTASIYALLFLKVIALSFIPILLHAILKQYKQSNSWIIFPVYIGYILLSPWLYFKFLHDVWLQSLALSIVVYIVSRPLSSKKQCVFWGVLGGGAAMISPIIGFVFACLVCWPLERVYRLQSVLILAVSFIVILPWGIRNYQVFDQLVLIKSNLAYDAYQGNYMDADGILSSADFDRFHPIENKEERDRYTLMGEAEFVDDYKKRFKESFEEQPGFMVKKSLHRIWGAYIFNVEVWKNDQKPFTYKVIKILQYGLPFICLIICILLKRYINSRLLMYLLITFGMYLLPYIFVGYYFRYRAPLAPVFCLFIALTISCISKMTRSSGN